MSRQYYEEDCDQDQLDVSAAQDMPVSLTRRTKGLSSVHLKREYCSMRQGVMPGVFKGAAVTRVRVVP